MLAGEDLIGTGPLGARIWSKPSVTVIGIDAPSISASANILIPKAAAKISMRIAPDAESPSRAPYPDGPPAFSRAMECPCRYPGHECFVRVRLPGRGPGLAAARRALETAFNKPVREKGTGGSIPLMHVLRTAVPHAEFILWGAEDVAYSCIHGTNESVDIGELERSIVAQGIFLSLLGTDGTTHSGTTGNLSYTFFRSIKPGILYAGQSWSYSGCSGVRIRRRM